MLETLRSKFLEPDTKYSPIPFWFWNDQLTKEELLRQIHDFHEKEVDGFVLHPRIGIPGSMKYLSDEFMELVRAAVQEAASLNMQVILYDEGMYPSGAANGEVVRSNPEFASRGLRMMEHTVLQDASAEWQPALEDGEYLVSVQAAKKRSNGELDPASNQILRPQNGRVSFAAPDAGEWSLLAFIECFSKGTIRGIHYGQDDGEPDAPRAADLLNPDAVRRFIELTHERYEQHIGQHFGSTVIAMFTDEPDLLGRKHRKGIVPWTNGFLNDFTAAGNREQDLPALWSTVGPNTEQIRANFRKAVRTRMEQVYYRPLYEWCEQRGIALTGHPAGSEDIGLLKYFHIPGQDIVWRWLAPEDDKGITGKHSTMGKCSSDAARHRGRSRNLNECFGVCGKNQSWALTADDMKWYLDWLFVRGVNMITPHAFYYSIEGKRLHERAPDVGPNNIWWQDYAHFSRYIKRLSWVMSDSVNQTQLAVLCQAERLSWQLAKPLFEQQIEFNYLEEELLQDECELKEGELFIAEQRYNTILLEEGTSYESKSWAKLKQFISQGGTVIELCAETPAAGDEHRPNIGQWRVSSENELIEKLRAAHQKIPVFEPLSPGLRMSHVVKDGVSFYLLSNEGDTAIEGTLLIPEQGYTEVWDAWNGSVRTVPIAKQNEGLAIQLKLDRRESLVAVVDPKGEAIESNPTLPQLHSIIELNEGWRLVDRSKFVSLQTWTAWEGHEHFSGTVSYEIDLEWIPDIPYSDVILDLGEVHELARVFLNGEEVGVRMWKPYRLSVQEQLQVGLNKLRVNVTNSLSNRYDKESLPSGLMGPVRIELYQM
ncbi:glycosylhydrolase-like jelly roll fold domain-containing protein [Marinicrinis lubricantis]|uniref:Glycosylhydrolase-like jelly roll fold domain-containing protein n=1 Tax=Marinicrinis lubricantis TaxID=2086470 RepID=A0ABW1ILB5_9BACL